LINLLVHTVGAANAGIGRRPTHADGQSRDQFRQERQQSRHRKSNAGPPISQTRAARA
jgi:hypothetical protein